MPLADTQRIIKKVTSLGTIREKPLPNEHIGISQIAPFLSVPTDDVIFNYIRETAQDTLAPARAQDAESRLRQSDSFLYGDGKASLIDWAHKNRYVVSDVMTYQDDLQQAAAAPLTTSGQPTRSSNAVAQFRARVARDDASRKKGLDDRLEWLIMTAFDTGVITYNDGKIIFQVDFQRPAGQFRQAPTGGQSQTLWDAGVDHDPIGNIKAMNTFMFNTYGIRLRKALISTRILNTVMLSKYWNATLLPLVGGTPSSPLALDYLAPMSWDEQAALALLAQRTGVQFQIYDGFYRTRPIGSTTATINRFTSDRDIFFYPDMADLAEIDNTELGFAKTLTSPHPEGNWQSGFYEWEDETTDPWMHVRGSGIKAFPVFPYLKYTYSMRVLGS